MNEKQVLYILIGFSLLIFKLVFIIMNLPIFLINFAIDLLLDLTMYFYEKESKWINRNLK